MEMAKIGVLKVAHLTDCPLCGEVSFSIFASSEAPDTRTVVGCFECGAQMEVQLDTLRNDEVRRALDTLMHDSHAPVWFKHACAVLHRAACVLEQVEQEVEV
jgi:hypothetical protein